MRYSDIEHAMISVFTQLAHKGTTKNAHMQAFYLNFYYHTKYSFET